MRRVCNGNIAVLAGDNVVASTHGQGDGIKRRDLLTFSTGFRDALDDRERILENGSV